MALIHNQNQVFWGEGQMSGANPKCMCLFEFVFLRQTRKALYKNFVLVHR